MSFKKFLSSLNKSVITNIFENRSTLITSATESHPIQKPIENISTSIRNHFKNNPLTRYKFVSCVEDGLQSTHINYEEAIQQQANLTIKKQSYNKIVYPRLGHRSPIAKYCEDFKDELLGNKKEQKRPNVHETIKNLKGLVARRIPIRRIKEAGIENQPLLYEKKVLPSPNGNNHWLPIIKEWKGLPARIIPIRYVDQSEEDQKNQKLKIEKIIKKQSVIPVTSDASVLLVTNETKNLPIGLELKALADQTRFITEQLKDIEEYSRRLEKEFPKRETAEVPTDNKFLLLKIVNRQLKSNSQLLDQYKTAKACFSGKDGKSDMDDEEPSKEVRIITAKGYEKFCKEIDALEKQKKRVIVLFSADKDDGGHSWCPTCNEGNSILYYTGWAT